MPLMMAVVVPAKMPVRHGAVSADRLGLLRPRQQHRVLPAIAEGAGQRGHALGIGLIHAVVVAEAAPGVILRRGRCDEGETTGDGSGEEQGTHGECLRDIGLWRDSQGPDRLTPVGPKAFARDI